MPPSKIEEKIEEVVFPKNKRGIIEETDTPGKNDLRLWLDSGALLSFDGESAKTIHGPIPNSSPWKKIYADENPADSDNGEHPQNVFRLVTERRWSNSIQNIEFKVNTYRKSASSNRNDSNGVLLFSRYHDSETLYYAGIRVDGFLVIKKKDHGEYSTLSLIPALFAIKNENAIPEKKWIRMQVRTEEGKTYGSVVISVSIDTTGDGVWDTHTSAVDTPEIEHPLLQSGHNGIRTDFMDAEFRNYSITDMSPARP
jgi:hypothetical protein